MELGETQWAVDQAIRSIGGYWPALAGLSRVLEEIGELAAALSATNIDQIADEAADCVIASMALANQYGLSFANWAAPEPASDNHLHVTLMHAGQIARAVNRIEGSKPPKPGESAGILETEFIGLYEALARIVGTSRGDLLSRAARIVALNALRDGGRFVASVDPITAPCRDAFVLDVVRRDIGPAIGIWGEVLDENDNGRILSATVARFDRADAIAPLVGLVLASVSPSSPGKAPDKIAASTAAWLTDAGIMWRSLIVVTDPESGTSYSLLRGRRAMPPLRAGLTVHPFNRELG